MEMDAQIVARLSISPIRKGKTEIRMNSSRAAKRPGK